MGKRLKRVISILLSATCVLGIVGCSSGNSSKSSMGRYVEERYEGPEGVYINQLISLGDGKIGMIGYSQEGGVASYTSEDGGKTWSENSLLLPTEEGKETIPSNMGYLSDGKVLVSYYFMEPMPEYQEGVTEETTDENTDATVEDEMAFDEEYEYVEPEFKYAVIDADGNIEELELDLTAYNDDEMGGGYNNFKASSNGDVFFTAGSNNEKIVQFDGETFEEEYVYESDEFINDYFLIGDSLIVYEYDAILEYDTTNGKEKGNIEVLEKETISENVKYYPTFINSTSENKLYYYNTLGLYAYDMKEKKVNQLVDAAISSFGDNEMNIMSLIEKEDDEFLAVFNDWNNNDVAIINYSYNPDIPSVPENQLVIYSLLENYSIRQAISSYAKANPDTYVKYEIGLSYGDGVTQSDALKTLNTEIMAGNGPDVIILDGLSAESYIEKGLLEDISDVVNPLSEDGTIFKNIVDAYNKDGKVYQIPMTFKFPMMLGNKDEVASISDLNSLVETTKRLSTQTEKRVFSNYFQPKTLVYALYYLYGNDWLNDDNTINEESLEEFFTKVNEMSKAIQVNEENYSKYLEDKYSNLEGMDNGFNVDTEIMPEVDADEEFEEDFEEEFDEEEYENLYEVYDMQYYLSPSIYADSFLFEDSSTLAFGGFDSADGYSTLISTLLNRSDFDYKVLTRGEESIFIPSNIIGVNAKGKNKEQAKEVVKQLLSEEAQKKLYGYGLPININTLKSQFEVEELEGYEPEFDEATGHYINYTSMWGDELGNTKEIKVLLPNEEDINKLMSEIEKLNVATTINTVLLSEVAKQFESYAMEEISLEEAINTVVDNLDLYLSE